jgi:hypothetical protein
MNMTWIMKCILKVATYLKQKEKYLLLITIPIKHLTTYAG